MKNREEFLLERKKGIGGSDVAAIIGVSPWKTALGVYLDKVSDFTNKKYCHDINTIPFKLIKE